MSFSVFSQESVTISGFIADQKTGEALIGATISAARNQRCAAANGYGFYSLTLPEGNHEIKVSHVGYEEFIFNAVLTNDLVKDFKLAETSTMLEQLVVSTTTNLLPTEINEFNLTELTPRSIQMLPMIFGEPDLIKAVQLQPGIKTIGDGSSGMFIRGGSADQNLILIDEAPVYNPSHMFGLVSVFNPEALNHTTLYKSNMPAQYGGRVSAVMDSKLKEGNVNKHHFSVGFSPFSAALTVDGPLKVNRSAFLFSARRSSFDLYMKPGATLSIVPTFYDLNLKANSKVTEKDRVFLSLYKGYDDVESVDKFFNKWGNSTATLRWNRNVSKKLFSNLSFIYSNYNNSLEFNDDSRDYKWATGLNDLNMKVDLSYFLSSNNIIQAGLGSIYHQFIPGESRASHESIPRIQAFEHALYLLNDRNFTKNFGLNYGIRVSVFQNTGRTTWFSYDENSQPVNSNTSTSGVYQSYITPEPRLSINYKTGTGKSVKAGYARNAQYLQVLQNNSLSYTSFETWFPANRNIKPIIADIFSTGWFQTVSKAYFFSAEAYYKSLQNQIDYVDHARLINNRYIEGETRKGNGISYGLELMLKKELGRLTGSVSYTYSKAVRKIEGINNNQYYNAPFDMPHDVRTNIHYKLNPRWSLSSFFIYTSGRPVTLPIGFYYENRNPVPIFSSRNNGRFPDYHRLDLAASYTTEGSNANSYWLISFGAFNAYARKNPIGYEFGDRFSSDQTNAYRYTLFTILPNFSVKYYYKRL